MQTERVRSAPSFTDGLKNLPLLLLSLFIAVGAVDLVLAMQPGLLVSLRADWQAALPAGSGVSTLVAAAVITGAVALSAMALTWFVRGVRSAPYLSLAPLWVGLCMLVIGRMTIELPIPLPTPAFVAICALLFVGSGVLFETRSAQNNAVGAGLSALPILLLILGYVLSSVAFDTNAMLLVLVLALAAGGAPLIAIACRANGAKLSGGFGAEQDSGEQMIELLERARNAEERALRAEQQLGGQPAWAAAAVPPRLADADEELALSRRSGGSNLMTWAVAAAAVGIVGAGYALAYQPLATELADQRLRSAKEAEALGFEMNTLRASAAREKQALEEKLDAAYATARQPGGAPGAGPGGSAPQTSALALTASSSESRSSRASANDDADEDSSEGGSERSEGYADRKAQWAAEKEAKRQERLAAREARRAERLAKREERLAARRAGGGTDSDADAADQEEEEEEEREARAAAREAKAAEREAKAAERAAKREARAAARAERETDDEEEEEAPPPKSAPKPSAAEDSDDPLEGLDGL